MNILITGSKGMAGSALVNNLKYEHTVYEFDLPSTLDDIKSILPSIDIVLHFAGVNRPPKEEDFYTGNVELTDRLLSMLRECNSKAVFMLASSIQASLHGRYDGPYGRSKLAAENLVFDHGRLNQSKVAVYRFPNLMGHSRPGYNSAVSTFCHAVANGLPYTVNDRNTELELLYIDDLVEGIKDLINANEVYQGEFAYIPATHKVTLGYIVDRLEEFKVMKDTCTVPRMADGSFEKKLFSLYLSYLPTSEFKSPLKMNVDDRGSFTELVHSLDCGQVSINISKPGITKGQHWHNSKWEIFIVVSGHGLIEQRNINTGEKVSFEVTGESMEAIYMIPGWTHNIINLSDSVDLVTVMYCNEIFDKDRPDTLREEV